MKHWLIQLFVAVDQLLNVLITPFDDGAWADETLSSRAYRMEVRGRPLGKVFRPLIDTLFFWEKNHCKNAYIAERMQRQLPPEARNNQ